MLFIVSDDRDISDGNTGAGQLSLREAIELANARPQQDLIRFDDGIDYIALQQALPTITDDLCIQGGKGVTIDGNVDGDEDPLTAVHTRDDPDRRVLTVGDRDTKSASADLETSDLVLTGGCLLNSQEDYFGGGIAAFGDSEVTLIRTTLRDNHAYGNYGLGGGIYSQGTVNIIDSVVTGNFAYGSGGAQARVLNVYGSEISNNQANGVQYFGEAGGLRGDSVHIEDSLITGNVAYGSDGASGGGIIAGNLEMTRSTVSDNLVRGDSSGGGGISAATASVSYSTISGNRAFGGMYGVGAGGISVGDLFLVASTVSGNVASSGQGSRGGGISANYVSSVSSTITGNSALVPGVSSAYYAAAGGGISSDAVNLVNTIVVGNNQTQDGYSDPATTQIAGEVTNDGFSLVVNDGRPVFAETVELLPGIFAGVLADNGGPTETVLILQGGLADGTADPTTVTEFDQRGIERDDSDPDTGAVEIGGLVGTDDPDRLIGTSGPDLILGKAGDDCLFGLAGNDTLQGGNDTDFLHGGHGHDTVLYTEYTTRVVVNLASQTVRFPESGDPRECLRSIESAVTGAGNDILIGNGQKNFLNGGAGDDLFRPGRGFDILVGSLGEDIFRFGSSAESAPGAIDKIRGLNGEAAFEGAGAPGGDVIDVRPIDADTTAAGNQAFDFGSQDSGGLWLVNAGPTTIVRGNIDADAAPEFELWIEDREMLAQDYVEGDFLL